MAKRRSTYSRSEHDEARAMFAHHRQAGTLKVPPGIMSVGINGRVSGFGEAETRYEHCLPDARRKSRRGE